MLIEERRRKNQSTRRKPLEAKDLERTNNGPATTGLLVQHAVVLLWVPEVIFCSS